MSVPGIEKFRAAMEGHGGSYVLIGGSACDLLLDAEGVAFRATKDLDIVVIAEGDGGDFARALWSFVSAGGYEPWRGREDADRFYRFVNPTKQGYPHMIELFARHPDFRLVEGVEVAPLPFDGDVSSLSAIILDDDYYAFMKAGLVEVGGLTVLDAAHLIPLKMRAHIDLAARKAAGQHVNSYDSKKHRKDVFRLLVLVAGDVRVDLAPKLEADARSFIESCLESGFRIDQLGIGLELPEALNVLKTIYGIDP